MSKESTENLLQAIAIITSLLIISLLVVLFLTNRYVLQRLWNPFYNLISQARAYTVTENAGFKLLDNNVEEFVELNTAMNVMSSRVASDFQNLKQFTENASHEILTPLALITSKLDTLIQDESLTPGQYEQIHDIYMASDRLSRLNQSLLLLVKIENNLLSDIEPTSVDACITGKLHQFQELMVLKQLQVSETMEPTRIVCSKFLMDILLNNIFSNAIRHNVDNGKIMITLTGNRLIFQNTGQAEPLNAKTVFDRFQKDQRSDGTGLGLTIARNICTLNNWDISYSFINSMHTFEIVFQAGPVSS
jgi:signal transduction histidine kinase